MALYALADLHFGFAVEKPMDLFGPQWANHSEKIIAHWKEMITEEDMVLLPGDISWGMRLEDAAADLDILAQLPGKKVILEGNHDYWWKSSSQLRYRYPNMIFLKNDTARWEDLFLCGSRGWLCPNSKNFTPRDEKIYRREEKRLQLSLDAAMRQGAKEILVMLHFPPMNEAWEPSLFTELMAHYPVTEVVYGHLHGKASHRTAFQGERDGIRYQLVSADYLDFCPKKIREQSKTL